MFRWKCILYSFCELLFDILECLVIFLSCSFISSYSWVVIQTKWYRCGFRNFFLFLLISNCSHLECLNIFSISYYYTIVQLIFIIFFQILSIISQIYFIVNSIFLFEHQFSSFRSRFSPRKNLLYYFTFIHWIFLNIFIFIVRFTTMNHCMKNPLSKFFIHLKNIHILPHKKIILEFFNLTVQL